MAPGLAAHVLRIADRFRERLFQGQRPHVQSIGVPKGTGCTSFSELHFQTATSGVHQNGVRGYRPALSRLLETVATLRCRRLST